MIDSIVTAFAALAGVWLGSWLDRGARDRQLKRESLFEVNKYLTIWSDSMLAKLPLGVGISDDYMREVNDRASEAKAMLEVIGSVELNLAFDDVEREIIGMLNKTFEYKAAGKLNPELGLDQLFAEEPQLENYRLARRRWINTLRKEVGVEAVKARHLRKESGG
jgi:hypothetical protein